MPHRLQSPFRIEGQSTVLKIPTQPRTLTMTGTGTMPHLEHIEEKPGRVRGRTGQRVPHATVEKRYRDTLNGAIENIRKTIPPSVLAKKSLPYGIDSTSTDSDTSSLSKATKAELIDGAYLHLVTLRARHEQSSCENHALERRIEVLISELCDNGVAVAELDGGPEEQIPAGTDFGDFVSEDEQWFTDPFQM
jgi:hypothetical protein